MPTITGEFRDNSAEVQAEIEVTGVFDRWSPPPGRHTAQLMTVNADRKIRKEGHKRAGLAYSLIMLDWKMLEGAYEGRTFRTFHSSDTPQQVAGALLMAAILAKDQTIQATNDFVRAAEVLGEHEGRAYAELVASEREWQGRIIKDVEFDQFIRVDDPEDAE